MQVDIPVTVETVVTMLSFAGAVFYQSAVIRSSLKSLTERMVKIEIDITKITEILTKQEVQSYQLKNLTDRLDRHEKWHEEQTLRKEDKIDSLSSNVTKLARSRRRT